MTCEQLEFFNRQLDVWPDVKQRYSTLECVQRKYIQVDECRYEVVFNPSRAASTQASVDKETIMSRPCFLCESNRPEIQQAIAPTHYLLRDKYDILVNPFPIYNYHFTISSRNHQPQSIAGNIYDMMLLCEELGSVVFYNGPRCGASAPDHLHFQAVDSLPLMYRALPFRELFFEGQVSESLAQEIELSLLQLPIPEGECEPMINIIAYMRSQDSVVVRIIPRRAHRPDCYQQLMVSPASIDLMGTIVVTRQCDFDVIDKRLVERILSDVTYLKIHPTVDVGIMTAPQIDYELHEPYFRNDERSTFIPAGRNEKAYFTLKNVTIGVGFHWQRKENQSFRGELHLRTNNDGTVTAINRVGVETYLTSVISSEMKATASIELLKAHAVISRSWLFAQIDNKNKDCHIAENYIDAGDDEIVKWYDHDDHLGFDVCADDHCQRYQGITKATTNAASQAVYSTWGEILTYDGEICDARFSKCCGGAFETFENCWEAVAHPYLSPGLDRVGGVLPDLTKESDVRKWITSRPESFCNTDDVTVLNQVLNAYDMETLDFYRWSVTYSVKELSEIIAQRSGVDFGIIKDLIPLERGVSGRITRLKIVGTRCSKIVGKELEIRRWLSRSHLYSSAFVVDRMDDAFVLTGAGWGHGVGLCQIGAAIMADKGYDYRQILQHYFHGAKISRRY